MQMKYRLILTVVLCCAMVISIASCSSKTPSTNETTPIATVKPDGTPASENSLETKDSTLPIVQEPIKLTWFVPLYNSNVIQSAEDQYCWQEIQARTGIDIDFIHPPVGTENDIFNVRIASGDYPDIVTWPWIYFAGGPQKALDDGVIIDLKDYMEKYAPNYTDLLGSTDVARANSTLDNGSTYGFIHIVTDPIINATGGYMMRQDWLDKIKMKAPVTIKDWKAVLTAFKEQDPNGNGEEDEIPFIASGSGGATEFSAAWGVRNKYHPDPNQGGKIVYGPIQPAFRDFLAEISEWYKLGLIDPEYPTNARKNIDEKVTTDKAGSLYGAIGSQLGSYNITGTQNNPGFNLIGLVNPSIEDGKNYSIQDALREGIGNQSSAVSTKNKYPVESVKLLDYCYSEEGRTLLNWGKEGESYEIKNGKPQYTELIMNNPEGKTKLDAVAKYAVPIYGYFSAFYKDSYAAINLSAQQQKDAATIWSAEDTSLCLPVLYSQGEENEIISKKGADINTYTDEMIMKFIIGKEPLDKFDQFVAEIKKMGVDELVDIYQDMYDRNQAKLNNKQ